jgi:2-C-methyl-D-erythritol 4-phosphate cytidylyltransferase/2-C-methyl-D-erythritol 2,4-cyclodiphosphate synthase
MKCAAIIVAAGAGRRAGGALPKQLVCVAGKPLAAWSLDLLARHPAIAQTILVVPPGETTRYRDALPGATDYVEGGETRAASVRAGLGALASEISHVLIHDAARPGLPAGMIANLLDALGSCDAVAPALAVVDALKRQVEAGLETVSREALYRIQTPQGFAREVIVAAHACGDDTLVDDLQAVERSGVSVALVEGSETLFKLTHPEDFARMNALLSTPRIGTGFDVHAFGPGAFVTLCGVRIPHSAALAGHSDADVAWHALTDAILGALGAGDIGDHFPPSDPQWKGAASSIFLKHAASLVRDAGYVIANCDLTLICEAPKIKPHRAEMRASTAACLGIDGARISVKATTTEGLGFTGRREGIAAQASVLLSPAQ